MKKVFQKILALNLALLVLFSTVSFTVEKHFCGDTLVDASIFSELKKCDAEAKKATASDCSSISKKTCCKDEKVAVDGQNELKQHFQDLNLQQQLFLTSFTYSYINLFEGLPEQVVPFKDYTPPLLVSDIHLLDETFLI